MDLLPDLCDPVRTAAAYMGGKRNLAKRLVKLIDAHPAATYAEPFVGMGGVFLRRTRRPNAEVINDISDDVTTFFRVLQRHYGAFMDSIRFQVTSRTEFERQMLVNPATLTDLERAGRFLYLQRLAFGGKITGRNFGVSVGMPARFDVARLAPRLEALHKRLSGVVIERLHYAEFIDRYDADDTLFYLDPPYFNGETDYGAAVFLRSDFRRLAAQLSRIKARFILSINDTPEIRDIFSRFEIEEVETTYSVSSAGSQPMKELIIQNRPR
jgi:DNA adenine methylase